MMGIGAVWVAAAAVVTGALARAAAHGDLALPRQVEADGNGGQVGAIDTYHREVGDVVGRGHPPFELGAVCEAILAEAARHRLDELVLVDTRPATGSSIICCMPL